MSINETNETNETKQNSLTRSQKREAAFLILYQSSLNDDTIDEIVKSNIEEFDMVTDVTITATAMAALENSPNADEIINKYSKTRRVERIAKISAAIMRLALYEMDNDSTVPDKVAINEAIELCKKYAGEKDSKFVSGVLGSYYREKHNE
jgi:N utilization substance protein B